MIWRMLMTNVSSFSDVDLPVVGLNGVDDSYPPQKKSFMMLHYMYEHFIDKFEWFLRADDDVFIKSDKLEKFLRRVDSSKAQFIGEWAASKKSTDRRSSSLIMFSNIFSWNNRSNRSRQQWRVWPIITRIRWELLYGRPWSHNESSNPETR